MTEIDERVLALVARFRQVRKAAGLSQTALADRLGLHYTSLAKIETGKQNLDLSTAYRIADALGVDLLNLLAGKAVTVTGQRVVRSTVRTRVTV